MAAVRFSRRAKSDLANIGRYTLATWGELQTKRYLNDLQDCCEMVAKDPKLGRQVDFLRPDLRRIERRRHVVFYRETDQGIRVSRILHKSMIPTKHPMGK